MPSGYVPAARGFSRAGGGHGRRCLQVLDAAHFPLRAVFEEETRKGARDPLACAGFLPTGASRLPSRGAAAPYLGAWASHGDDARNLEGSVHGGLCEPRRGAERGRG
jgi:hypothetical protein